MGKRIDNLYKNVSIIWFINIETMLCKLFSSIKELHLFLNKDFSIRQLSYYKVQNKIFGIDKKIFMVVPYDVLCDVVLDKQYDMENVNDIFVAKESFVLNEYQKIKLLSLSLK